MSYRTQLRDAVCQTVIDLRLAPTATLSAPSPPGAASVVIPATLAVPFVKTGILSFWDGTTEPPIVIADSVTVSSLTTLSLSFAGRYDAAGTPITGLLYDHPAGSLIATNLLRSTPNTRDSTAAQAMLASGYPVWRVFCLDSVTRWPEAQSYQTNAVVNLIYSLSLTQPWSVPLSDELWRQQQHDRADGDVESLVVAMIADYNLQLAVPGNPTFSTMFVGEFVQAARPNYADPKTPLIEQYLDIHVEGDILNRQP